LMSYKRVGRTFLLVPVVKTQSRDDSVQPPFMYTACCARTFARTYLPVVRTAGGQIPAKSVVQRFPYKIHDIFRIRLLHHLTQLCPGSCLREPDETFQLP
ncbi:hypothetical protein Vretimale_15067, partial [Volvox reticuliferus]